MAPKVEMNPTPCRLAGGSSAREAGDPSCKMRRSARYGDAPAKNRVLESELERKHYNRIHKYGICWRYKASMGKNAGRNRPGKLVNKGGINSSLEARERVRHDGVGAPSLKYTPLRILLFGDSPFHLGPGRSRHTTVVFGRTFFVSSFIIACDHNHTQPGRNRGVPAHEAGFRTTIAENESTDSKNLVKVSTCESTREKKRGREYIREVWKWNSAKLSEFHI
ncbi:hypothetical protein B0H19DRAFT_1324453 [Mycena capillaripes]|nr:hypothetical protein B0H19DRAFT_1324453 [Mycena capillaripes]